MKLELKSIKHSAFASEETHCFQANLYVDGKVLADVSNNGRGGPDRVMPHPKSKLTPNSFHDKVWEIGDYLTTLTIPQDLEDWVGDAVNEYLDTKVLRAKMRTHLVVEVEGKAAVFTTKGLTAKTDGGWHKGYRILNHMPFADALVIWKEKA